MAWDDDQDSERAWWGDCASTYTEETKQLVYASRMGLVAQHINGQWPLYDLQGRSVLDVGGGPVSLLLKTYNRSRAAVVDPCEYPAWVGHRYAAAGISYLRQPGETDLPTGYDEVWIYNVLQHTQDPERIIGNAKEAAPTIRLFEWIGVPAHEGHPHELRADLLDRWLGDLGQVEQMDDGHCVGISYSGVFRA